MHKIIPCTPGPRKRSITELLFYMLRSGKKGEGIWTVQKEMEPVITTQQHFKLSKIQRREQKKQWKYIEETYSTSKKINQDTGRPAVIVSNNDINESQNMVEVAYLVEKPNESLPTHAKVRCHLPSTALCEQVVSVSKDRIDGFIRTCTDEEIEKINKGLSISLGITESDDTMAEKLKELTDSLSEAQRINDGLRNRIKEESDKQQELEKQLSQIETENTDETIKVAAERDIYKDLYMKLTEKLIGDKI